MGKWGMVFTTPFFYGLPDTSKSFAKYPNTASDAANRILTNDAPSKWYPVPSTIGCTATNADKINPKIVVLLLFMFYVFVEKFDDVRNVSDNGRYTRRNCEKSKHLR
jgi:hypothetical protein